MAGRLRKFGWGLVILVVLVLGAGGYIFTLAAPIAAGYKAKCLCSAVFVSHRDPGPVEAQDLASVGFTQAEVDRTRKQVTAGFHGWFKRTAVYRPGLGCTLVPPGGETPAQEGLPPAPPGPDRSQAWPLGDAPDPSPEPPGLDRAGLEAALRFAFAEPDPEHPRLTRAVVVVHRGRLVAERYAPGYDAGQPLLGWSMAKSVTSALLGVLVKEGKLSPQSLVDAPEWRDPDDPRRVINLDVMLRMSSGLAFDETYANPLGDALNMLFMAPSAAGYAAAKPLAQPVDSVWSYSSGTTNVLSRLIRQTLGGDQAAYWAFPRRALFGPIGMKTALMEPDPAGDFVGSSFCYASARDWARFGLLHLQDGVWQGVRLLPQGWVGYITTPAPAAPGGIYGAHWWLNAGPPGRPDLRRWPRVPADTFMAVGFQGQYVSVVPSREAVVVRLGCTPGHIRHWPQEEFLAKVLKSLPK